MQVGEMKSRLIEKIKGLEQEKSVLLEEVTQLREAVELSEKAKELENEVGKLKGEVETLKRRIPRELLVEFGESELPVASGEGEEEEALEDECVGCEEEELL
jgi:lipid II:glycine glycyltransferase (peptidoglycan interpeptide bridge formation enzyme)